ncbi:hypothetical protein BH09BAC4_BH09BAC4_14080 [soil metagenome]
MTNQSSPSAPSSLNGAQGLTTAEAEQCLTEYGPNTIETIQPEGWFTLFVRHSFVD